MAGPWTIPTHEPGGRYSCFARVSKTAQRWARMTRAEVFIEYLGQRDAPTTNQIAEVNFWVSLHGVRRIDDPRWQP
jgi:hypothetical protein